MIDFNLTPFITIWETTQACDLACVHCRAEAQPFPLPGELNHNEGLNLVRQVADMGTPVMVLSGGDPMKRTDLSELIRYGKKCGLRMGTIPAATPSLNRDSIRMLKAAGLDQMALSLDAPTEAAHDRFRGVPGSFAKTLQAAEWAHEAGLPLQINTVIGKHNFADLDALFGLVGRLGIVFWEVFFLVPTGRGQEEQDISAELYEEVFAKLYAVARKGDFVVKITEAPHFKRYYIQQQLIEQGIDLDAVSEDAVVLPEALRRVFGPRGTIGRAPAAVNSGKGYVFIAYNGDVFPSGFLPVSAGNVRVSTLKELYQDAPLFRELRNADALRGRCGVCPYRKVCGGSRSRAFALTGDYMAEDSSCAYQPPDVAQESLAKVATAE